MATVLIVEDEKNQREILREFLESKGYKTEGAGSGKEALKKFESGIFDTILMDIKLPDTSGIELLKTFREINPEIPIIMTTAYSDVELVIEAMKSGAFHYLVKPINLDELLIVISRAIKHLNLVREIELLKEEKELFYPDIEGIIAESYEMKKVLATALKVAKSRASVLITGETGTGKELIARFIHRYSPRKDKPFIPVNVAAIPETLIESELFGHVKGAFTDAVKDRKGYFQMADGGTIFLDEIGELPVNLQPKLLRVLQEGEFFPVGSSKPVTVDIRVIAATNKNLEDEVKKGNFREDLFYRLNVIHIHIKPLRERREDIPYLLDHFLKKFSKKEGKKIQGFTREAYEALIRYNYPGNVRELENIVERAVVMAQGELITTEDLPLHLASSEFSVESNRNLSLPERLELIEKTIIIEALKKHNWVKTRAAKELGISERVLRYRMEKLGIKEKENIY